MAQQLQLMRYVQDDATYNTLCDNASHWTVAIGGDSHGREIADQMYGLIGRNRYEGGVRLSSRFNFCRGGMILMNFQRDGLFSNLRNCPARIILLHLGGNDLDMESTRESRDVINDLLLLIVDLEREGKIVY